MKNRIRILTTSDIHGYIYPTDFTNDEEKNMGMAKLHTLIDNLRDENTIVIDNGDCLQGSPLTTYHATFNRDEVSPVTKAMNAMHYDFVNLGNHDFDYGQDVLFNHLEHLDADCITANINYKGKPFGPTYVVKEVAGKKVAIFGLITKNVPHWESKSNITDFRFKAAYDFAKKTVEVIRRFEKPDYIICVYHGGFERNLQTGELTEKQTGENVAYKMIREIPHIDVMITGHQHISRCGNLFNTAYTQVEADGKELACIDIYTDTRNIETMLFETDMDASEEILNLVEEEQNLCEGWLDSEIGKTQMNLEINDQLEARFHKSQVVTLINNIQKEVTGADLAACSLFNDAPGFHSTIRMRDLVLTYTFPNSIVKKEISGKVLKEYLEQCAEFFAISNEHIVVSNAFKEPTPKFYNYDMIDGVEYTIQVSRPVGKRIVNLTYNGEVVTDDMMFTIALNNYRANGGGNFEMLKKAKTVQTYPQSLFDLLETYIKEKEIINFEPVHNIKVMK